MLPAQDISSGFALDAQSVGKLRLQAKNEPDAALRTVAQQFESIFVNMLLKSMREATPQDGLLDSEQGKLYTQLYDQQLAQKLSAGKGIGLADMMVKQLTRAGIVSADSPAQASGHAPVSMPASRPTVMDGQASEAVSQSPATGTQDSAPRTRDSALGTAFKTPKEFVDALWPHAVEAGKALGIPPHYLLGQAALESGWGKRQILAADGKNSHNLFGIKAGAKSEGAQVAAATTEYVNGAPQARQEQFRAYGSYAESFRDYADLLRSSPRYQGVVGQNSDAAGFAHALQRAGYATDPAYASKLARVVNSETMRQALAG
ncbi:MAG: flagellar assembly peptidoglycan hydrolase FlgJ [Sulfuricella sp.]|nr:flagellar assembly peptidoglycan hydrolase FlgJ [Sulfuricella sp.]